MDNGIIINAISAGSLVLLLVIVFTFLKIARALSELTDKISTLISIAYEAEHNPEVKVGFSSQEDKSK